MSEDDKQVFKEGRPYIVGLVALILQVRMIEQPMSKCFDEADEFVREFEKRNGLEAGK